MARQPETPTDGVFINCPFDQEYEHLFDSLIFAVFACGFHARSAREADDGGEARVTKLLRITRNWLTTVSGRRLVGGKQIVKLYTQFRDEFAQLAETADLDPADVSYRDFAALAVVWLADREPRLCG